LRRCGSRIDLNDRGGVIRVHPENLLSLVESLRAH
jgi:hypothetical protein